MVLVALDRPVVGEDDRPNADITPRPGCLVNDFQSSRLALELPHVKSVLPHWIAVVARRRMHDLSVNEQVDADFARMIAAADPEADEIPLDGEWPAGERAGTAVFFLNGIARGGGVRIDHPRARRADVALVVGNFALQDGAFAEGVTRHRPAFVGLLLKILENNVGAAPLPSPPLGVEVHCESVSSPGLRSTWFCRSAASPGAVYSATAFSSQPANRTSTFAALVFLTV